MAAGDDGGDGGWWRQWPMRRSGGGRDRNGGDGGCRMNLINQGLGIIFHFLVLGKKNYLNIFQGFWGSLTDF